MDVFGTFVGPRIHLTRHYVPLAHRDTEFAMPLELSF